MPARRRLPILRLAGKAPYRVAPVTSTLGVRVLIRFLSTAALAVLPVAGLNAHAAEEVEFRLLFWPTKEVEKDPRFLQRVEGACGDLVIARVRRMPNPTHGDRLATDVVYELTPDFRVLRTWHVPANAVPLATQGRELLFSDQTNHYLVGTNGKIRQFSLEGKLLESAETTCRLPSSLKGSGYARCHRVPRLNSPGQSIIAFQGPCT